MIFICPCMMMIMMTMSMIVIMFFNRRMERELINHLRWRGRVPMTTRLTSTPSPQSREEKETPLRPSHTHHHPTNPPPKHPNHHHNCRTEPHTQPQWKENIPILDKDHCQLKRSGRRSTTDQDNVSQRPHHHHHPHPNHNTITTPTPKWLCCSCCYALTARQKPLSTQYHSGITENLIICRTLNQGWANLLARGPHQDLEIQRRAAQIFFYQFVHQNQFVGQKKCSYLKIYRSIIIST